MNDVNGVKSPFLLLNLQILHELIFLYFSQVELRFIKHYLIGLTLSLCFLQSDNTHHVANALKSLGPLNVRTCIVLV